MKKEYGSTNLPKHIRTNGQVQFRTLHQYWMDSIPSSLRLRRKLLALSGRLPWTARAYHLPDTVQRAESRARTISTGLFWVYPLTKSGDEDGSIVAGPSVEAIKAVMRRNKIPVSVHPMAPHSISSITKDFLRRGYHLPEAN